MKAGGKRPVTIVVARDPAAGAKTATITLRATSESDPSKSASISAKIWRDQRRRFVFDRSFDALSINENNF